MNNKTKLIGGIIVFGLVLISKFLIFPYNIIIAAFSAVFFYFFEYFISGIENYNKKRKEINKIKVTLEEIYVYLKKYTSLTIKEINELSKEIYEESELDFSKINISKKVFSNFEELNNVEKNVLQILFIVDLISREKDMTKISGLYKETISQILEGYNFLSDKELISKIANWYNNYKKSQKFEIEDTSINADKIFDEFANKYCRAELLAFKLKLDKEQAEELRKTLVLMYTRGKLSVKQLGKDIFNDINIALEEEMKKSRIYLFISNYNWRGKVDEFLKIIPHLRFGRIYPNNLPPNLKFLHMRILYPAGKYNSMENFLQNEIVTRIPPEEKGEGYVCLVPINGGEMISFPDKIEKINNSNSRKSYNELKSIRTGHNFNMLNIILDNIDFNEEKSIGNLLSIIPFNIFVPKIKEEAKAFIISNYEDLRKEFNINELTDWGKIEDSKKLAEKIIEIDKSSQKRVCDDSQWTEISEKILNEAIKYKNALGNI